MPSYIPAGAGREDGCGYNHGSDELVYGRVYVARVTTYAPDGSIEVGGGQIEHAITPPYTPYGFE